MNCLDINNEMIITTVDNNNEYLVKYKAIESNSEGEIAIVLEKVKLQSFVKDLNDEMLSKNNNILINRDLGNNDDSGNNDLSNNIDHLKGLDALTDNVGSDNKGFDTSNLSIRKILEINNIDNDDIKILQNHLVSRNHVVNQKRQVSLKEFLDIDIDIDTNSIGRKPLETDIDKVLSAIAKQLRREV